jgi:hypothetical protein
MSYITPVVISNVIRAFNYSLSGFILSNIHTLEESPTSE